MMRATSGVLLALSLTLLLEDARPVAGAVQSAKKTRRAEEEKHDKIGLALYGGSITAANICGSVMRGFQQQRITVDGEERPAMDAFDYTSGLSGGNFPNIMYAFAQNANSDELLDADGITDPEEITAESLSTVPEKSMFATFTTSIIGTFVRAVIDTYIHGWEFWPLVVYYHFLEPLGIPPFERMGSDDVKQRDDAKPTPVVEFTMSGPPELYPEWIYQVMSRSVVADLKEMGQSEPNVDMPPVYLERVRAFAAFYEESGYPFPPGFDEFFQIPPESLLEAIRNSGHQVPVPFFSTPQYVESSYIAGTMEFDPVTATANMTNVTKTADPLDFAPFVANAADPDGVGMFSLERLLGFGTALLPIFLDPNFMVFPEELTNLIGGPLTLAVPTTADDGSPTHRNMSFADGGYNDGTGIPALVKLKCRKIVSVLLSTGQGLDFFARDPVIFAVESMKGFFGVVNRASGLNPDSFSVGGDYTKHLFDLYSDGENQLHKLADIIQRQHEAGNPPVATLNDLDVVANPFWGTEAGAKVDLTIIVVLGVPKRFSDRVSPSAVPPPQNVTAMVDEYGFFTNPDLTYAPNSLSQRNIVLLEDIEDEEGNVIIPLEDETTIELPLEFKLGVEETRMTNFLMSWVVKDAWDGLTDADGNVLFEGFRSILDPSAYEEPTATTTAAPPAATTTAAAAGTEEATTTAAAAGTDEGTATTTAAAGTDEGTTTTTTAAAAGTRGVDDTSPAAAHNRVCSSISTIAALALGATLGPALALLF